MLMAWESIRGLLKSLDPSIYMEAMEEAHNFNFEPIKLWLLSESADKRLLFASLILFLPIYKINKY